MKNTDGHIFLVLNVSQLHFALHVTDTLSEAEVNNVVVTTVVTI